ncbi:CBS domain-containing protein [Anabaena azotica]|uniref:CBS domain-containing protein n=1 Tax=Anabaena azotica TaxID=197653 RepID=UPI0039A694DF
MATKIFSDIQQIIIDCPLTLTAETPVIEAVRLMSQVHDNYQHTFALASDMEQPNHLAPASCILVVENDKLVGIFTARDIVKCTAMELNLEQATLAEVMIQNPITIKKSEFTNIVIALNVFRQHKIHHLPIVDDQNYIMGLVTPTTIRQLVQATDLLKIRTVEEVMTTNVIQAPLTASISQLAQLMAKNSVSSVVITKSDSQPIGIVTERDIVQIRALELDILTIQADMVMSTPLFYIYPQQSLWEAHQQMQKQHIRRLIVVDHSESLHKNRHKLRGIISQSNLIYSLDTLEMYETVNFLQQKVGQLESEKMEILQTTKQELLASQQAEAEQKKLNEQLETRLTERTKELIQLNEVLLLEIVERKQAEKKLQKQLATIESTIDGIAILKNDQYLYVNKAHLQMFGYDSPEELIGKSWRELYNPEEIARFERKVFPILIKEKYWRGEAIAKRRNGNTFNQEVSLTLTQDSEVICVCRDITESKNAEQALQESEQKFRQLAENLQQVFWMTDPERSQILYISPAYEKIWGRSCQSLYENPKSFIDAIYADDRQEVENLMQKKKEGFDIEYRLIHSDGSMRWIRDQAFPVKDKTGEVYRVVGIAKDITERKRAEQDIFKAFAREKELGELKSRFVSMTSHEFRTPLAVISSSAGILKDFGHKLDEEQKIKHLECIQTYVRHTTQLLDDILLINKAESGKLAFEPGYLDLIPFCQKLVEEIQISAPNHIIGFFSNPQYIVTTNLDKKLLRQILINLLSNAIKYSPQNSTVNFDLNITEQNVIFSIQDYGIGIPEADQLQLFESFHRASNVGNIPGTGLGLSIVAKCVDLHKGSITVNSQLGIGTNFTVTIPL